MLRCPWASDGEDLDTLDVRLRRRASELQPRPFVIGHGRTSEDSLDQARFEPQSKRTYSNSIGRLLMPLAGGAIQFANFPGSMTRPISEPTNW